MIEDKEDLTHFLQKVRLEFLRRLKEGLVDKEYKKIIKSLNSPDRNIKNLEYDYRNMEDLDNNALVEITLVKINTLYEKDKKEYIEICRNGQYVVWVNIFKCAENLVQIKNSLNSLNYSLRPYDYFGSCDIVKEYLDCLANAYKELVILEKRMGIERYLATSGLKNDIELLHNILREIRTISNKKLTEFMEIFQMKWNLTSVSKAIKRSFSQDVDDDEISSSMIQGQERVIYLLLDGFGYTQYLWFLSGLKERSSLTYGVNIFKWLKSCDEYQDKLILGSTLVTDTASAISTIFSGELPSKTGIMASKLFDGKRILDIKKTKGKTIRNLVEKYPNTFLNNLDDIDISILQGSRYFHEDEESFSGMIYGNLNIDNIDPIDRIFKAIAKKISSLKNKQLIIAYLPLIDRTGHSIGAFTSFESYEYEKLNILLVDFLLNLAYNKKEVFDGKTKVIISADHGMFETSSNHVTFKEIINEFYSHNTRPPMIAVNNRSLILYNISENSFYISKKVIEELLVSKNISYKVFDGKDKFSKHFVPTNKVNTKTLIILFDSDGIALATDKDEILIHNGGHGGASCEEVFVPFITIELTSNLRSELLKDFSKIK